MNTNERRGSRNVVAAGVSPGRLPLEPGRPGRPSLSSSHHRARDLVEITTRAPRPYGRLLRRAGPKYDRVEEREEREAGGFREIREVAAEKISRRAALSRAINDPGAGGVEGMSRRVSKR